MPDKPQLDRFGVAAALQEIAQLMDLKGGQFRFKAKAYNAGARAIQGVADLDRLVKEDRLTTLPRIGDALASQIKQLYLTGESSVLNGLRQEFPKGVIELSSVQGLSVEKIKQLDEAGISSIAQLKAAAETGRLEALKGFGPKTAQRLLTRSPTTRRSMWVGVRPGLDLGREDRSTMPAAPCSRYRSAHRRAVLTETLNRSAARVSGNSWCTTQRASRRRPVGDSGELRWVTKVSCEVGCGGSSTPHRRPSPIYGRRAVPNLRGQYS